MISLLTGKGKFYLSFPISYKDEVHLMPIEFSCKIHSKDSFNKNLMLLERLIMLMIMEITLKCKLNNFKTFKIWMWHLYIYKKVET